MFHILPGGYAGAILGFPLAGLITHYLGWQYIFYVSGNAQF
jgi:MFS family permease